MIKTMNQDVKPSPSRITWIGHGSVLLEHQRTEILIDPVLRQRIVHLVRTHRVDPELCKQAEAVLLTHAHHDHLDLPSLRWLLEINPRIRIFAPNGAADVLTRASIGCEVVSAGDVVEIDQLAVRVTPAVHSGERGSRKPNTRSHGRARSPAEAVGYVVRGNEASSPFPHVWIAGDTEFDERLATATPVDIALVPIGDWWRRLGPGHMDPEAAARAVALVGADVAIPIHWGTFRPLLTGPLMREVYRAWPREFTKEVARHAPAAAAQVLAPGGIFDLSGYTRL